MSQSDQAGLDRYDYKSIPPPIGKELREFLHSWLIEVERTRDAFFPVGICWAIRGRALDVLDWLDTSKEPRDYEVAKEIRRIGTMDYYGQYGYFNGMWAFWRYGYLAEELGNKTWKVGSEVRLCNRGKATREYYLRYGELPYFD